MNYGEDALIDKIRELELEIESLKNVSSKYEDMVSEIREQILFVEEAGHGECCSECDAGLTSEFYLDVKKIVEDRIDVKTVNFKLIF